MSKSKLLSCSLSSVISNRVLGLEMIRDMSRSLLSSHKLKALSSLKPMYLFLSLLADQNPEVGTDWLYAVIVKNTFFSLNKGMNKPEGYAVITRGGGFLNNDFLPNRKHYLSFSTQKKLQNCYLVELGVNGYKEED